jgi:membrane-associated protease RseP (regulator of RpoE activity)
MWLGEPERTQADLFFRLFGIPVRVHPFFWLVAVILGANLIHSPVDLLLWVLAVFVAILVHELGHALVMRGFGFRPAITLYGLGGYASYDRFWDGSRLAHHPLSQILIHAAGPGASLALAAGILVLVWLTGQPMIVEVGLPYGLWVGFMLPGSELLNQWANWLVTILLAWSFLNLLPVYPLDGGQIVKEVLEWLNPRQGMLQTMVLSVVVAGGFCVAAVLVWKSWFLAILFGYLAVANFLTLQAAAGGPWR